jgi:hypothetical protein
MATDVVERPDTDVTMDAAGPQEITEDSLAVMTYQNKKKLAVEVGVPAKGKDEELSAAILDKVQRDRLGDVIDDKFGREVDEPAAAQETTPAPEEGADAGPEEGADAGAEAPRADGESTPEGEGTEETPAEEPKGDEDWVTPELLQDAQALHFSEEEVRGYESRDALERDMARMTNRLVTALGGITADEPPAEQATVQQEPAAQAPKTETPAPTVSEDAFKVEPYVLSEEDQAEGVPPAMVEHYNAQMQALADGLNKVMPQLSVIEQVREEQVEQRQAEYDAALDDMFYHLPEEYGDTFGRVESIYELPEDHPAVALRRQAEKIGGVLQSWSKGKIRPETALRNACRMIMADQFEARIRADERKRVEQQVTTAEGAVADRPSSADVTQRTQDVDQDMANLRRLLRTKRGR